MEVGRDSLFMALLNLWSLGHFVQWGLVGRFVFRHWPLFFALSIGWELLELVLPYDFAKETWDNKISDLLVNTAGYVLGLHWRPKPLQLEQESMEHPTL
jgi:glycopeptide antibiotics resistance protein